MLTNLWAKPSEGRGWLAPFGVWLTALFHPTPKAYEQLLSAERVTLRSAYWSLFSVALGTGIIATSVIRQANKGWFWSGGALPFAVFELAIFAVSTGILFGVARLLGGTGSYTQFIYISAAITAPLFLIATLLGLWLPTGSGQMLLWILPLSMYASILSAVAVKAVHKFSWARAILTVVLPGTLVYCGDLFFFGSILTAVGPTIVLVYPVP